MFIMYRDVNARTDRSCSSVCTMYNTKPRSLQYRQHCSVRNENLFYQNPFANLVILDVSYFGEKHEMNVYQQCLKWKPFVLKPVFEMTVW